MTKKFKQPVILSVDDGYGSSRMDSGRSVYSFVFSSNLKDWMKSPQRQINESRPNKHGNRAYKLKHG